MNCQMPSTPPNQHRPRQQQKGQGYYQDDDYAIAHGTRRSAKDGSVYMQKTQQEDPTVIIQIPTSCVCFEDGPSSILTLILIRY